jgi:uncharacterized protein YecE (DUF72 family)
MPVIATAAWSIPKAVAGAFPEEGSGLTRYATRFQGVEVNSTFYRQHRASTYARWAESVPDHFRFALKMPKTMTHEQRLIDIGPLFDRFLEEVSPLGERIGPFLCQLPPSLAFEHTLAERALTDLRQRWDGRIVLEARHRSWASPEALDCLADHRIDRVLADPAPVWPATTFAEPPVYVRLHGTPKIYYSSYDETEIGRYRQMLADDGWCVFDNTASGAAIANALTMRAWRP